MQQAIPNRSWPPISSSGQMDALWAANHDQRGVGEATERIQSLVTEHAMLVMGRRGCCMSHVVNRLYEISRQLMVYEMEDSEVQPMEELLGKTGDEWLQFPTMFIGEAFTGGLNHLMVLHISGELVPILKKAGALWV